MNRVDDMNVLSGGWWKKERAWQFV